MSVLWKWDWPWGEGKPGDVVLSRGFIGDFAETKKHTVYARIVKENGWLSDDESLWEGPIPPISQHVIDRGRNEYLEYTGQDISEEALLGWMYRYKETLSAALMTADIATGDRNARDAQGGVDA